MVTLGANGSVSARIATHHLELSCKPDLRRQSDVRTRLGQINMADIPSTSRDEIARRTGATRAETDAFLDDIAARQFRHQYGPPESHVVEFDDRIVRALWDTFYVRPPGDTFHDWIISVLESTLGTEWLEAQRLLRSSKRHVVVNWLEEYDRTVGYPSPIPNETLSGYAKSLLVLAEDVYRLRQVNRFPNSLLKRLRDLTQFQGARYELAVSATMIRCGFKLEWKETTGDKIVEFAASHPTLNTALCVEAKSRHRAGVLHQMPAPDPRKRDVVRDIKRLLGRAMEKCCDGLPLVVFIDLNLPPEDVDDTPQTSWFQEASTALWQELMTSRYPRNPIAVFLTNFSWHYDGTLPASDHLDVMAVPPLPDPAFDTRCLSLLHMRVREYGNVPQNE